MNNKLLKEILIKLLKDSIEYTRDKMPVPSIFPSKYLIWEEDIKYKSELLDTLNKEKIN